MNAVPVELMEQYAAEFGEKPGAGSGAGTSGRTSGFEIMATGGGGDRVAACRACLQHVGSSIEGDEGSKRVYEAARLIWNDFGLDFAEGYLLLQDYNRRSDPPWPEEGKQGLRRKWDEAVKKGAGPEGRGYKFRGQSATATISATGGDSESPPDALLPCIDFDSIEPSLESNDLVEGLYGRGGLSVLFGPPGTGKTFFALDAALHMAGGIPWRGRRVEQGGVIYIACEGQRGIRNRVAAFKKDRGCDPGQFKFTIVPVSVNLRDAAADTTRVIATVKRKAEQMGVPVAMVIVDTLARAMAGGDENSSQDMGALIANAGRIQQALEAHVQLIHHSGKDAGRGSRGHSSLKAALDTEIEVARDEASGVSVAKVTKQKDGEDGLRFAYTLRPVELGVNQHGKPVTSCVVDSADAPKQEVKLTPGEKKAYAALKELVQKSGRAGDVGVPPGIRSVPLAWWRERYCGVTTGEAEQESAERAFRRHSSSLEAKNFVGREGDRAWLASDADANPHAQPTSGEGSAGGVAADKPDKGGQCPVCPPTVGTGQSGQNPLGLSALSAPSANGSRKGKKYKNSAAERRVRLDC